MRLVMSNLNNFPLEFKTHNRAKRMKLRYDAAKCCAVVTMPPESTRREAQHFASLHISWLEKQRKLSSERIFLSPGYHIPIEGIPYFIVHKNDNIGLIKQTDFEIVVGGDKVGFSKRLENYLKKLAQKKIEPLAQQMAKSIGLSFRRIQIRDTKSRWGSCSSSGTLSFSWRLIMCPNKIIEYVVAHEVSHIKEMNHSPAFWSVVDELVNDAKISRKWLKSEGQALMMILSE